MSQQLHVPVLVTDQMPIDMPRNRVRLAAILLDMYDLVVEGLRKDRFPIVV